MIINGENYYAPLIDNEFPYLIAPPETMTKAASKDEPTHTLVQEKMEYGPPWDNFWDDAEPKEVEGMAAQNDDDISDNHSASSSDNSEDYYCPLYTFFATGD